MWSVFRERLRATQGKQHEMRIHQNPMPNHLIAHMEAEDTQPTTSELVTIQRIQVDLDLEWPVEDEKELDAPVTPAQEAWTEEDLDALGEDSLGWETQMDDTWDNQQDEREAK